MWNINNLISKETLVDCGPISVEFFNDDLSNSALDTDLFLDDRTNNGSYNLASIITDNVSKKGMYPIKYRVYHSNYIANIVTIANPFTVEIIDPCENDALIISSTLINQEYTITDTA